MVKEDSEECLKTWKMEVVRLNRIQKKKHVFVLSETMAVFPK